MSDEFVIRTKDGRYVSRVGGLAPFTLGPLAQAKRYSTRFAALGDCNLGGAGLHGAAIVPYMAEVAPRGVGRLDRPTQSEKRASKPRKAGNGHL